jgi:plastocyanin
MKTITLTMMMLLAGLTAYSTTWQITNVNFTFAPATITITLGDSVKFNIASIHQVVEVSESTWNANDNDPLAGGFSTPSGGGLILPGMLEVGTHWYVCVPHASGGMKGMIIVEEATATEDIRFPSGVSLYPNPSNGKFQLIIEDAQLAKNYDMAIYDVQGRRVYTRSKSEMGITNDIDLTGKEKGLFIVKLTEGKIIYSQTVIIQ